LPCQDRTSFNAPAANDGKSVADRTLTEADKVPPMSRVPPELLSYKFQPRQVIASEADIPEMALRLVHDPCGELAAANDTVTRDENAASDPETEVGDPDAHCIHRPAGCVAAAAPVVQSSSCFAM
jgi:hypothetical protein